MKKEKKDQKPKLQLDDLEVESFIASSEVKVTGGHTCTCETCILTCTSSIC